MVMLVLELWLRGVVFGPDALLVLVQYLLIVMVKAPGCEGGSGGYVWMDETSDPYFSIVLCKYKRNEVYK